MKKSRLAFALGAIFLAVAVSASLSQVPNPLDPLKVCPDTHKLLFENAVVRVIEAKVPPGQTEPKHSHLGELRCIWQITTWRRRQFLTIE